VKIPPATIITPMKANVKFTINTITMPVASIKTAPRFFPITAPYIPIKPATKTGIAAMIRLLLGTEKFAHQYSVGIRLPIATQEKAMAAIPLHKPKAKPRTKSFVLRIIELLLH
jgi:hypothetical protein